MNGWLLLRNARSRTAVHKSRALPIASSVRLLKLLPKDGPTCDLASMAAMSLHSLTTSKSHSLVGRKKPGSSTARLRKINSDGMPASVINSLNRSTNPSICAPPVTALRRPWSALPAFACRRRWEVRVCQ